MKKIKIFIIAIFIQLIIVLGLLIVAETQLCDAVKWNIESGKLIAVDIKGIDDNEIEAFNRKLTALSDMCWNYSEDSTVSNFSYKINANTSHISVVTASWTVQTLPTEENKTIQDLGTVTYEIWVNTEDGVLKTKFIEKENTLQ